MSILVIEKQSNRRLSYNEILNEVNRDRSESWSLFTMDDLISFPDDVTGWLNRDYFDVVVV